MMSRRKQSDNIKRIAIGSAVAAIAGYLAGLLTAPKSGKETRGDIKQAAEKGRAEAEKELKKLHTELDKAMRESKLKSKTLNKKAQGELKVTLDKAADTKEKIREVLSAIHEGDAEDQDLKRAIKNANSSIEHLRDYFKK